MNNPIESHFGLSINTAERVDAAPRTKALKAIASMALLASLTSCTSPTKQGEATTLDRNTPSSAPYSLDANPDFDSNVRSMEANASNETTLSRLKKLANQPVAEWLVANPNVPVSDLAANVSVTLKKSVADQTIPVFVSYAIPDRDLGGQSKGGLDARGYKDYLNVISKAIGQAPAIMVVEPDALANVPDPSLGAEQRSERISLLADALNTFHTNTHTAVYLDAGNSAWRSAGEMADLLKQVEAQTSHGIDGISLNVSNFRSDTESRTYAAEIQKAYGKRLYTLIDDSRNGDPRAAEFTGQNPWCNPPHQRLGHADTLFDARAAVETVFIKTPGESDGVCNTSQVPAGSFDNQLLLDQVG